MPLWRRQDARTPGAPNYSAACDGLRPPAGAGSVSIDFKASRLGMAIVEYPQSTKCTSPVTAPERSDSRYSAEPPTSVRVGVRFSGELSFWWLNNTRASEIPAPDSVRIGPADS